MTAPVEDSYAASQRVRQLLAPGRRQEHPGLDDRVTVLPTRVPRHNLPGYASTFVGRHLEIADVAAALGECRLVTLTGAAGIGKTRLALEVAATAVSGHPDGVWFVELASVGDPDVVAEAVMAELPDVDNTSRGAPDLVEQLRFRRTLLVLDNCEHLTAGCASLVQKLLRSCPDLSVLATSREPLGVAGERLWWVAPLGLPAGTDLDSSALAASEAVQLFVDRARGATPGFCLDAEVAPAVAEICHRLDGLPLAIELAAARLSVLSPAEIVERLDDRFGLLRSRVGEGRHQTLRAALDWSHDLLSPAEAALFRRVAVFAGGCTLRACELVCPGDEVSREEILDLLEALVGKSLVTVDRGHDVTRYRMLESVRHFALEKLESYHEAEPLRARHARWCEARAERADRERRGRRHEAWRQALEEDQDNFRAALVWAREKQRVDVVLALGAALCWFWETRGHLREGLEWLTWAIDRDPGDDQELRAKALRGAGMLSWLLGDVAAGVPMVEESVVLFRMAGNEEEAAGCVCSNAFYLCGNPAHTLPRLEDQVAQMRAGGDLDRLAHALINCGLAYFFAGEVGKARTCFEECLALPPGGVEPDTIRGALLGLGRVALLEGNLDVAEATFRSALDLAVRACDRDGRSTALSWIGDIARARGDFARARSLIGDALELVSNGGPALSVARCKQFLARVEQCAGALDTARSLYMESLSEAGATDMPYHQVRSLLGLGETAIAQGSVSEAGAVFEETLAIARANCDRQAVGRALAGLAVLARSEGDVDRAVKLRHEALEVQERVGDLAGIVSSLEALAILATAGNRHELAARLFGAAHAARTHSGCARTPLEGREVNRSLKLDRIGLGREAFDEAWAQGARLSAAEAVSYAAKGRGSKLRPATGWDSLSRAERDIAGLVTEGLTNKEIADKLFVSVRTVSTHLTHIYRKLGVGSRRQLTREAVLRHR